MPHRFLLVDFACIARAELLSDAAAVAAAAAAQAVFEQARRGGDASVGAPPSGNPSRAGAGATSSQPPTSGTSPPEGMAQLPASAESTLPRPRRHSRARTSGRGGIVLANDPFATRRSVDMPAGRAINHPNVFGDPDLGLSEADRRAVTKLAKTAALMLNQRATFCQKAQAALERVVLTIKGQEARLALCKVPWGVCSLLSKAANNRQAAVKLKERRRERRATAAPQAPASATDPVPSTG